MEDRGQRGQMGYVVLEGKWLKLQMKQESMDCGIKNEHSQRDHSGYNTTMELL